MRRAYRKIESRAISLLETMARKSFISIILLHLLVTGIILFMSKVLEIDTLHYGAELRLNPPSTPDTVTFPDREVGYLWAINWTFYFSIIMTSYVYLFHHVLRETRELFHNFRVNKMLVYRDRDGKLFEAATEDVWTDITRRTAKWMVVVFTISISAGFVQWYQYSGQWFYGGFDLERFLQVSTGVDWNVAGSIESLNSGNGHAITIFALVNYLYYGVGWTLMFTFYIFLIMLFVELHSLARARSKSGSTILLADEADSESGGFGSFKKIQSTHAIFSVASIASLYLMSLRNNYLPHECSVPNVLSRGDYNYDHCKHLSDLMFISVDLIGPILESGFNVFKQISLIVDVLFFSYVAQNTWTLGPFFNIIFVCAFFLIISSQMKFVITSANKNRNIEDDDFSKEVIGSISRTRRRTLWMLALGGVGALFINVGSLMIVGVILWPVKIAADYTKKNLKNLQDWLGKILGISS